MDPSGTAPHPSDTDLTGVARDAETILELLAKLEARGYRAQFMLAPDGPADEIECATCRRRFAAAAVGRAELRRLEGASDPDDMLAIVALECPRCATRGTMIVNYGPAGSERDDAILLALDVPVTNRDDAAPLDPERVRSRAEALQPEEARAGTDDAEAQATAILEESDAREADRVDPPGPAVEHRHSEDTVDLVDE